jgi:catechol 2,3-dioxygenase-like lactoylglutathione lyase family enzyme
MLADKRVHAVMPTHDVERLAAFYRDTLGLRVRAERPSAVIFETSPGSVFVVSRTGSLSTGAHTQMAFSVTDLDAEVADLRSRGVEPEAYEMPKTENGVATLPAGRAAWFRDPDGNLVGLFEWADPT